MFTSSVKSNVVLVQFSDAPEAVSFKSSKSNGIAVVGEAVEFTCNTTSMPMAVYEIRHNNVLISTSANKLYVIATTSFSDEGIYTCVAYNYLGYSTMSSTNLTIHGKLYILIMFMEVCIHWCFLRVCVYAHVLITMLISFIRKTVIRK